MKLVYTDRSKDDVDIAFSWYEKQRKGLGFEFLDCIEISIKGILRFPEMYPFTYSKFRGCTVRRFPFSIFYTVEEKKIVVHSVFDSRQDPKNRPR